MYDFSKQLMDYQNKHVNLEQEQRNEMRDRRDSNRQRIENGIGEKFGIGNPANFVIQGSYAMWTMIQDENNDYDIDDGVKIHKDRLIDDKGVPYTPDAAKDVVLGIFKDDGRYNSKPSRKKNCVRIDYSEGYHIDIPVYRYTSDINGNDKLELASDVWEKSDPKGVTQWFKDAVSEKSPDDNKKQMRQIVRLVKMFIKKNKSVGTKLPCGFAVSKLVDEVYNAVPKNRFDTAFLKTCELIRDRLRVSLTVEHPVLSGTMIIGTNKTNETISLLSLLDSTLVNFHSNINKADPDTHYDNVTKSWGILFNAEQEFKAIAKKYVGPANLSSTLKEVTKVGGSGGYA